MINKTENENLQITLKKQDVIKLKQIQADLIARFNLEITKSQAIAFLIRNYGTQKQEQEQPQAETITKPTINYKNLIALLKNKLNMSYNELSEYLNVSVNTLKKWSQAIQNPTGENEQKLLNALKENKLI